MSSVEQNQTRDDAVRSFQDVEWGSQQLRSIILFRSFNDEHLRQIYAQGTIMKLKKSSHAVIEGEPSRGLFLILAGKLSVFKKDLSTGDTHRLADLEEGNSFGELSLFDEAPRSATVIADRLSYVFNLPAESFEQYLAQIADHDRAEFYRTCAVVMSERFRSLNSDYITAQQLLWKYALRRDDEKPEGA
jgi:CRP-like cAMP-binding protein